MSQALVFNMVTVDCRWDLNTQQLHHRLTFKLEGVVSVLVNVSAS